MNTLSSSDVLKLIKSMKASDLQAKAYLDLAFHSSLRPAELCDLRWEDITPGRVAVRCGKGGRARMAPLAETYGYVEAWREQSGSGYVFKTRTGHNWQTSHVRRLFARLRKLTGIAARPHGIRHAAALAAWNETKDLGAVSRQLGHRRLATTDEYLKGRGVDSELDKVAALRY